MKLVLIVLLFITACLAYEVSYEGYQVLRCQAKDRKTFQSVMQFGQENFMDIWSANEYQGNIDINLSPDQMSFFLERFANVTSLTCENFIEDVQALIDEEAKQMAEANSGKRQVNPNFFDTYRSYDEIVTWMNNMAATYSFMYVDRIGVSTQGTTIWGIRMNGGDGKKGNITERQGNMPTVYYQGGQHAREWIGPVTVCYILNTFAENYGKNGTITQLVDSIRWVFVPVVNPDGYTFSRNSDRLWRKNRRNPPTGSTCWGVDTNRNWPAYWNQGGSSTNPCSETYHGISSGSEVEVQNVVNYFNSRITNCLIATDWHSYGQYYLIPYGWTTNNPPGYNAMMEVGNGVAAAIRAVNNQIYTVGSTSRVLYIASGSFTDWAFQAFNVRYSQTIELRDTGRYGFVLPASEILPTGRENFNGVIYQANRIL